MYTDLLFYAALTLAIIAILSVLPFAIAYTKTLTRHNNIPAFCDLLDYATLIKDNLIVLKSGALCAFYEIFPDDQSQLNKASLTHFEQIIQKAFLKLGGNWAVHFDVKRIKDGFYAPTCDSFNQTINDLEIKRILKFKNEKSFESRFFLTLTFLGTSTSRRKIESLVLNDSNDHKSAKESTLELIEKFQSECKSITDTLSLVIKVKALTSTQHLNFTLNQTLSFIHSCITGKEHDIAVPKHNCYLDALLSTKDFSSGFTPKIGNNYIACIAIDGFPQSSYLGILNSLALLPFSYRFHSRFLTFDKMQSHILLEKYRRLWSQKSRGILSQIFNQPNARVNEYAIEKVSEIDEAKFAFEGNEEIFGAYTSVIIIMDENMDLLQEKATLAVKTIEDLGFAARVETVNAIESYLGSLPGHCFENIRRPILSGTVFTDLIPLSTPWNGERFSPNPLYGKNASPLMQVKSAGHSRFYLNLHQKDLGNTAVVGPPGSGKSVLLGSLILNLMRYKNMKIFAFDKGYSFYAISKALSGSHIEFSNLKSAFCPLYHLENSNDFTYAQDFIELLCRMSGHSLSLEERNEINHCLKILAQREKDNGNEKYNIAISELKQRLSLIITALIGTAFGFICLGAYIVKSSQSQIIPYLVTVDTHGVILAKGRIDLNKQIPQEAIAATLSNFIKNLRSVTSDSKVQRDFILETYAYVKEGSPALQKLNDFYNNENPFIKQEQGSINIIINNVITQEHNRLQIDWTEEISDAVSLSKKQMFRAILAYSVSNEAAKDPDALLLNPLQIFVEDFAVSAVLNN